MYDKIVVDRIFKIWKDASMKKGIKQMKQLSTALQMMDYSAAIDTSEKYF